VIRETRPRAHEIRGVTAGAGSLMWVPHQSRAEVGLQQGVYIAATMERSRCPWRHGRWLVLSLALATLLSGCSLVERLAPAPTALTIADAADCPVTTPTTAPAEFAERLFGSGSAVGNDALWVGGLGADGVIPADPRFVEPDGSIGWKLGWRRITPGTLTITGRRLDAPAAPLRASVPEGYGDSGFQASGVYFPTEGCWEVTGSVGDAALTFVVFVLKV
jgi:hypothetical protein